MRDIYTTSFCNFGHDVKTGRPVGHECYILSSRDLRIERDGTEEEREALFRRGMRKGRIVCGR